MEKDLLAKILTGEALQKKKKFSIRNYQRTKKLKKNFCK